MEIKFCKILQLIKKMRRKKDHWKKKVKSSTIGSWFSIEDRIVSLIKYYQFVRLLLGF